MTVNEDAPEQTVNLTGIAGGPNGDDQTLTLPPSPASRAVVPNPTVQFTGSSTGTLKFTPVPNELAPPSSR